MQENGEDTHAMQTEENVEELKGSQDAENDAELKDVQKNGSERNSKKRVRKTAPSGAQATPKKPESKEPITPVSDRPARERKSIDRFADSVEKEKEKPKEFKIEQGAGTCLKDIPNVVFKLSKRKWSDDSVQLLHKLLFNKRVKIHHVKSNILQFSGCVWGPNEDKEKAKMKEKLEKCVKDNLWQVSDLLDINISKGSRKEDLVMRVFEFLDCPHKTTEKLLQEEEQKLREKKRNKTSGKGKRKKSSGQTPRKRPKREANENLEQEVDEEENQDSQEEPEEEPEEAPVKKKKSIKIKEPSRDAKSGSGKKQGKRSAKKSSESEQIEEDPEEPLEEPEEPEESPKEPKRKRAKNKKYEDDVASKSPKKGGQKSADVSKSPKKGVQKSAKKKPVYDEPGEEDVDEEVEDVKSKSLSKVSKKAPLKEAQTPVASPSKEKKKAGTGSMKASSKKKKKEEQEAPPKEPKKSKGASNSEAKEEPKSNSIPPDEDLRAAICELLRDADFSTVTFTDVVKQLGAKFDVDLSQNKAHVKNLIQEEISKIVDEDDGEGDNEDEEAAGIHTPEKKEETIAED